MGCLNSTEEQMTKMNPEKAKRRITESKNIDIRKNYEFISMLGNGAFGKVRLYRDRNYKDLLFAIKTLKKEGIPPYEFSLLKSEVNILSNLDHPNIVKYFGTFEDEIYLHIVMEYLKGHDLYKIISLKKYTGFDEKNMAQIIQQLLKALVFIHSKGIVHRDIKPENILFSDKRNYSTLRLIDFGLATNSVNDHKSVGTPYYMSPEMINKNSCTESDMWSVGVILYLMLTDKYPFDDKNGNELFYKIRKENYDIAPLEESECSEEAKDFIQKCLKKNPLKRMSSIQGLEHPWIQKFCAKNDNNLLNNDVVETLLDFSNKNVLQKEIYYFIAKISKESEIENLKMFFNQLDSENTGTLTIEEIKKGFKKIGIDICEEDLLQIYEGLDFHKDGTINYSEFLAAMISSYNFEKGEKLWSVFNLFKENNKKHNYITYDSLKAAVSALNLNINEKEMKECFKLYDKEIKFEDFKKLILEDEQKDKLYKSCRESSHNVDKYKRNLSKHLTQKNEKSYNKYY